LWPKSGPQQNHSPIILVHPPPNPPPGGQVAMEIIQISTNTRCSGIKTPQIAARSHPKDTQKCREFWDFRGVQGIRWDRIRCLFVCFKCEIGGLIGGDGLHGDVASGEIVVQYFIQKV